MFKFILLCTLIAYVAAVDTDVHNEVKHLVNNVRDDGFEFDLLTSNGVQESRSGDVHGDMHGNFEWVSPEGVHVKVSYVANELGYQPNSDLLPTPPPIPAAILRSLEWIKAHPHKEQA